MAGCRGLLRSGLWSAAETADRRTSSLTGSWRASDVLRSVLELPSPSVNVRWRLPRSSLSADQRPGELPVKTIALIPSKRTAGPP
jgi:hypothetical protein